MTLDHRSAVGDFQSLVSLRAQHFKTSVDGELSAADMDAYRQRVNEFKANCVGPGVRVAIFGRISSGVFVTAERASFLVQERSISFDWTEAQRLLHRADSVPTKRPNGGRGKPSAARRAAELAGTGRPTTSSVDLMSTAPTT